MALRAVTSNGVAITPSSVSLPTGGTFDLYNTADQTTNYERLRAEFLSNTARIVTQQGGTGVRRNVLVGLTTAANSFFAGMSVGDGFPFVRIGLAGNSSATAGVITTDLAYINFTGSSGTQIGAQVAPTINQSGTAGYTALDVNPTESATGSGTKLLQRWAVGGSALAQINSSGTLSAQNLIAAGTMGLGIALGSADVTLFRDAADNLALRRDTNAQTFRAYNTYTDASNGEWGFVRWAANEFLVGNSYNGTGVVRPMSFQIANVTRWTITTSGNWVAGVDNTYDIGASGATRPRTIYVGNGVISPLLRATVQTVAGLLAAATAGSGARCTVSDSTVAMAGNYGAIVAGGGADIVPVFSDGTNWRIG